MLRAGAKLGILALAYSHVFSSPLSQNPAEDERGQKDADEHDRPPRSMLMSEESRDSGSIPGLSRGGSPGGLPNQQSSDFSKPIIQEDVSPVWVSFSFVLNHVGCSPVGRMLVI